MQTKDDKYIHTISDRLIADQIVISPKSGVYCPWLTPWRIQLSVERVDLDIRIVEARRLDDADTVRAHFSERPHGVPARNGMAPRGQCDEVDGEYLQILLHRVHSCLMRRAGCGSPMAGGEYSRLRRLRGLDFG